MFSAKRNKSDENTPSKSKKRVFKTVKNNPQLRRSIKRTKNKLKQLQKKLTKKPKVNKPKELPRKKPVKNLDRNQENISAKDTRKKDSPKDTITGSDPKRTKIQKEPTIVGSFVFFLSGSKSRVELQKHDNDSYNLAIKLGLAAIGEDSKTVVRRLFEMYKLYQAQIVKKDVLPEEIEGFILKFGSKRAELKESVSKTSNILDYLEYDSASSYMEVTKKPILGFVPRSVPSNRKTEKSGVSMDTQDS